ncbi:GPP34 family phosphoprotein [Micromonospora sp. NPDC000212]
MLRIADALFLIGHDEFTGKPHSSLDRFESALAGAALAELLFDGRIAVDNNSVACLDPRPWNEALTDLVIAELQGRGNKHSVKVWVRYLREVHQIRERVGGRLTHTGIVRREEGGMLRRVVRWPATDPNEAARPRVVLAANLRATNAPIDLQTATLATLADVGGLRGVIALERATGDRIDDCRRQLPAPLAALLTGIASAVDAATITVRR